MRLSLRQPFVAVALEIKCFIFQITLVSYVVFSWSQIWASLFLAWHMVQFCRKLPVALFLFLGFFSYLVVGLAPGELGSLDRRKQSPIFSLTVVLEGILSSCLEVTGIHPGTRSQGGDQDESGLDVGHTLRSKSRQPTTWMGRQTGCWEAPHPFSLSPLDWVPLRLWLSFWSASSLWKDIFSQRPVQLSMPRLAPLPRCLHLMNEAVTCVEPGQVTSLSHWWSTVSPSYPFCPCLPHGSPPLGSLLVLPWGGHSRVFSGVCTSEEGVLKALWVVEGFGGPLQVLPSSHGLSCLAGASFPCLSGTFFYLA